LADSIDAKAVVAVTFGYPKVNSAFIVIYGALAGYLLSFFLG
jgi:chromate transporter